MLVHHGQVQLWLMSIITVVLTITLFGTTSFVMPSSTRVYARLRDEKDGTNIKVCAPTVYIPPMWRLCHVHVYRCAWVGNGIVWYWLWKITLLVTSKALWVKLLTSCPSTTDNNHGYMYNLVESAKKHYVKTCMYIWSFHAVIMDSHLD